MGLASYFNWAPGYPQNNGNCAVLNYANDGTTFVWQDADCEPQYTLNGLSLCQMRSCDAESVACGFVEVIILASSRNYTTFYVTVVYRLVFISVYFSWSSLEQGWLIFN
uniref:C-type lectin domain-containing protein n=1 Tax=Acrobeloides nanus TaxID=290746 RepID=A0A914EFB8_9BILA